MQHLNPKESPTWGSRRPILHAPTGRQFDLAREQPAELIEFLANLHDNLPHFEHRLSCQTAGDDQRVYVVKCPGGGYSVRHYRGCAHTAATTTSRPKVTSIERRLR